MDSEARQGDEERRRGDGWLVPASIVVAGIIIALAIVYANGGFRTRNTAAIATPPPAAAASGVSVDDDPALGSSDAPVTIIEFSDFQCPFCRRFWRDALPRITERYIKAGTVRFVYRDFPISSIHDMADPYAQAGECADEQGKFWPMHDKIFGEQDSRGPGTIADVRTEDLKRWARAIGLEGGAFDTCLDSGKYAAEVAKDLSDGQASGVTGTPTFFINGRSVVGALAYEQFVALLDAALVEAGP